MTMKISILKYAGMQSNKFVFANNSGIKVSLFSNEVSWSMSAPQLSQYMNNKVGIDFRVGTYTMPYGYYIKRTKNDTNHNFHYEIYDGEFNTPTGKMYDDFKDIPNTYNDKPVYKFSKYVVLGERNGDYGTFNS